MRKKYILLTVVLILMAVFLRLTLDFWIDLMPECIFLKVTGFYCPGCGATRAVSALLNFKFITAFKYNPGIVSLAIIVVLLLCEKIFTKKILPRKLTFWVVFIIVLFSYYIIRNFTLS